MITTFGRNEHQMVSGKIQATIKLLGDELGVDFDIGGGQIGSFGGMIKVGVKIRQTASGIDAAKVKFAQEARYIGADPEWYGKTAIINGKTVKISGINTGAPKYPIQAVCQHTGKSWRFTVDGVRRGLL